MAAKFMSHNWMCCHFRMTETWQTFAYECWQSQGTIARGAREHCHRIHNKNIYNLLFDKIVHHVGCIARRGTRCFPETKGFIIFAEKKKETRKTPAGATGRDALPE